MDEITLNPFTEISLRRIRDRIPRSLRRNPNPELAEGAPLPESLRDQFGELAPAPSATAAGEGDESEVATATAAVGFGVPLEEVDEFYENTYIVVSQEPSSKCNPVLYRFNVNSPWHPFSPLDRARRLATKIYTNWIFRLLLQLVIIVNFLSIKVLENEKQGNEPAVAIVFEIGFLLIYTCELIIQVIAKGILKEPFTSAWSFWFWFDVFIITFGITALVLDNPVFKAVAALRLLKIVPITPGLRRQWNFLFQIVHTLLIAIIPLAFGICCYAVVITMQLFAGALTSKCVRDYGATHEGDSGTPETRRHFYNMSDNWLREDSWDPDSHAVLCGSGSPCPEGYICMIGFGPYPDHNYTHFDSFSWALLSIFRLVAQDYAESLYHMIATVANKFSAYFLMSLFFIITLPFLSFVIGIIAKYMHEDSQASSPGNNSNLPTGSREVEPEEHTSESKAAAGMVPKPFCDRICCDYIFCWRPSKLTIATGKRIVNRPIFEMAITTVLIVDMLALCLVTVPSLSPVVTVCKLIYIIEFVIRYMAAGGFKNYISQCGNTFAFLVLVGIFLQAGLNFFHFGFFTLLRQWELIRVFRLAYKWDSLGLFFRIIGKSLRDYRSLFGLLVIYICVFAKIGNTMYAQAFINITDPNNYDPQQIPRWNFKDFMHSFMLIFRLLCTEWIETMWDCFTATEDANDDGPAGECYLFYTVAVLIGKFLTLAVSIAIVLSTIKALDYLKRNPQTKTQVELICASICIPISKDEAIEMDDDQTSGAGAEQVQEPRETENTDTTSPKACAGSCWTRFRAKVKAIRQSKLYDGFSIVLIFIVLLSMIPTQNEENLKNYPKYFKMQFVLREIFKVWLIFIELPLRFVQFGCKGFFRNFGCVFELITAMVFILTDLIEASFKLPIFYLLLPFLLVDRINRLKVVPFNLYQQIRWIYRYVLAGAFIWLVFAVDGIFYFGSSFNRCQTTEEDPDAAERLKHIWSKSDCKGPDLVWENAAFNFDDILESLMSLSLVAIFKGWIEIMHNSVDANAVNEQPGFEVEYLKMFFFVTFIVFGVLFVVNILIGVFVHNLGKNQARLGFLTEQQKESYQAKLDKYKEKASSPEEGAEGEADKQQQIPEQSQIPEPTWKFNKIIYSFVTNIQFDKVILGVILFNAFLCASSGFGQNQSEESLLAKAYCIVLLIYLIEIFLKLLAWRGHYFKTRWNVFDFIILILAFIDLISVELQISFINLAHITIFRIFRLYRLGNLDLIPRTQDEKYLASTFAWPNTPEKSKIVPIQLEVGNDESQGKKQLNTVLDRIYAFVTNFRFDGFIMLIILVDWFQIHFNFNYMTKADRTFSFVLVPVFYYIELLLKLIAWRQHYFTTIWNMVDFAAVLGLTLRRVFGLGLETGNPYVLFDLFFLLETLRVFRILRFIPIWQYGIWKSNPLSVIFNHVKLRILKRTVVLSFPTIFNLFCFYMLVLFSYSLYGHALFLRLKLPASRSFSTVSNSFFTMSQIAIGGVGAGIDGVYLGISNTKDCKGGECGSPLHAKLFLITFFVINGIIFLNMYLTIILETFNQISIFDQEVDYVLVPADKRSSSTVQKINKPSVQKLSKPSSQKISKPSKSLGVPGILKRFKLKPGSGDVVVESETISSTYQETKLFQPESMDDQHLNNVVIEEISLDDPAQEQDEKAKSIEQV